MNNLFVISSSLMTQYGIYSLEERFNQLCETIDSINQYAPNSIICIFDTSEEPIPVDYVNTLNSKVDRLALLIDHPLVKELKNFDQADTNLTGKKTFGELIIMLEFLHWIKNQNIDLKRVFKISGRFRLNERFVLSDYDTIGNTIVTSRKRNWHGDDVYVLRLWSFDYSMIDTIIELYLKMYDFVVEVILKENKVRIIEFCFHKYIHEMNIPIIEFDTIGCIGSHGQDGVVCDD